MTSEADAYIKFLNSLLDNRAVDGSLQIMYTIHGEKEMPELELSHLDGHKGKSRIMRLPAFDRVPNFLHRSETSSHR